jgi:hypothetical protein
MAFYDWQVEEDTTFVNEADPTLKKLERKASSNGIIQDQNSNMYWANTVGKTKHPGVYDMHLKELQGNMYGMINSEKMSYREMEDFMVDAGYELGDIRACFEKITKINPEKFERMRLEDVKSTPSNIPHFNLGWGLKKQGKGSFFIQTGGHNLFTIYEQADDMTRSEHCSHLRLDSALAALSKLVKEVHRYDMPISEMVEGFKDVKEVQTSEGYEKVANQLQSLKRWGGLNMLSAHNTLNDALSIGTIDEREAQRLFDVYAAEVTEEEVQDPNHADGGEIKKNDDLKMEQDKNVAEEVSVRTPQDFFKSSLPDRMDEVATEHVKNVLSYITNRNGDLGEFEVSLKKFSYEVHEDIKAMIAMNPHTGKPIGNPKATISAILAVTDRTLRDGKNKKFALAVFFVGPDGDVTTSDSVKGEDDIVYGFSDEGLTQYFNKSRESELSI